MTLFGSLTATTWAALPNDDPGPVLPFPPGGDPESPPLPFGPAPALGPVLRAPAFTPVGARRSAAPSLLRGVSDGASVDAHSDQLVHAVFVRAARAGAAVVRLSLSWRYVERYRAPPADPTDPADPAYFFDTTDNRVRLAAQHGLVPLLRISSAPDRHEGPNRWPYAAAGSWDPDPVAYGRFAQAAARRYSGHFPDPVHPGRFLPRVTLWQAWNEANLPLYLSPQWVARDGRWVPFSAPHYRRMLNAFYAGVKAVDRANLVVSAGTAPNGSSQDGFGRMAPVRFWQEALCLGSPPRVSPQPCPDPAHMDVLAYHPLSIGDPDKPAPGLGVSIVDIDKLGRLLRSAQRMGRVFPARGTRLYVTEINWESSPPNPRGATAAQVTRWIPRALYLLWSAGVDLVTWELFRDPPGVPEHSAGLYSIDRSRPLDPTRDRPKPALAAFRFPLALRRATWGRVEVWALLPPPPPGRPASSVVELERRDRGHWRPVTRLVAGRSGMLDAYSALKARSTYRLVVSRYGQASSLATMPGP